MRKNKTPRSVALGAVTLLPLVAHGQSAGMNVLSIGWLHVAPVQHSTPLTDFITPAPVDAALRLPQTFTSDGTSLKVSNTDTVGVTSSHFFTDHIAVTTIGGIPPLVSISSKGTVVPPGPAGQLGKLDTGNPALNPMIKSARAWTPAMALQYYFGDGDAQFRPFAGVGVSYAWFTDIQLSNNAIAAIRNTLGAPLAARAGLPGLTQVQVKSTTSWSPVANVGFNYRLTENLGLTASVTYIPLKTTAVLYVKSASGQMLAQAKSRLTIDPVIPYLGVTYSF
jgi:outer membrane protein